MNMLKTTCLAGIVGLLSCGSAIAAPQASITLKNCSSVLCNANNTEWTLDKTGPESISGTGTSTQTIHWDVTATKGITTHNYIVVEGLITVTNTGTANATIGNIVVNLQKPRTGPNTGPCKNVPWVSAAVDVADATNGDAATTANIVAAASSEVAGCNAVQGPGPLPLGDYTTSSSKGTFTEKAGSSTLEFTDAGSNTIFSLTPQKTLAPNETITLLYSAKFDNTVLNLPVGSQVRAEAIVSFGNAGGRGGSGASATYIDVNGNGSIDTDEANVRSVPCRVTQTIPPLQTGNATVTLSDTVDDIAVTPVTGSITVDPATFDTNIEVVPTGSGEAISATTTDKYVDIDETCTSPAGAIVTNTAHLDGDSSSVSLDVGTCSNDPTKFCKVASVATDCASLEATCNLFQFTCVTGIDIDKASPVPVACDADIPPLADICTYTRTEYHAVCAGDSTDSTNAGCLFDNNYQSTFNHGLTIGINNGQPNPDYEHHAFWQDNVTGKNNLKTYLGSGVGGQSEALSADNTPNPTSTNGGELARSTAALTLNVEFGTVWDGSTIKVDSSGFGERVFCGLEDAANDPNNQSGKVNLNGVNLTATQATALDGISIKDFLADANKALGEGYVCKNDPSVHCTTDSQCTTGSGDKCSVEAWTPDYVDSYVDLRKLVLLVNQSYDACVQSAFASSYLCEPSP